jgi:hypothetical protein
MRNRISFILKENGTRARVPRLVNLIKLFYLWILSMSWWRYTCKILSIPLFLTNCMSICYTLKECSVFVYLPSRELLHSHDSFTFAKQTSDLCEQSVSCHYVCIVSWARGHNDQENKWNKYEFLSKKRVVETVWGLFTRLLVKRAITGALSNRQVKETRRIFTVLWNMNSWILSLVYL